VVIGAGPTGLLLASELRRHGVEVRIVDKVESPSRITKASQVSSRTLEVFEDIGVLDRALEVGHKVWGATVYAEGGRALRIASDDLDAPYKNCTQARANGDTNIPTSSDKYGTHLDRDGDGIGCESSN